MLNRLSLAVITTLNLLTVYLVVVFEVHHLHDENHLFENLQVLLLCLSVVASTLLLPFAHPRLLEELFEINAYAFMAWPALRRFRAFGQAPAADLA
jgi:hypothetical protein